MKYRAEIDGLRALAVVPVILFHAGYQGFSGGFIGVDVFFVISGYLITTILIDEIKEGKFSILNFYERRVRRLLPALFFVIITCLPFAWVWLLPQDLKNFSQSLVAVSVFSSNIFFWKTSGYFDTSNELKPLIHTWSLSVEEQFYMLFPLLLLFTWKLGRRWAVITLATIAGLSLFWAESYVIQKPSFTFYMLATRAWELLIGVFSALIYSNKKHKHNQSMFANIGSFFGLGLIFYSIFTFNQETPFPGLYGLIPTIGTALIILLATDKTLVGKILSTKPFVWIGLISYSAYLWHQPIFAFARQKSLQEPNGFFFALLVILTLIMAYLSWKYIENPFRNRNKFSRKRIFALGIFFSLFFMAFGFAGHKTNGFVNYKYAGEQAAYLSHFENSIPKWNFFEREKIQTKFGDFCDFYDLQAYRQGHATQLPMNKIDTSCYQKDARYKKTVFIWGDSHAQQLRPGLLEFLPEEWQILQVASSGCAAKIESGIEITNYCNYSNHFAYEKIIANKPDVLLIAQNTDHDLKNMLKITDELLKKGVGKIIFVGPSPHWTKDLPSIVIKFWEKTPSFTNFGLDRKYFELDKYLVNSFPKINNVKYVSLIKELCNNDGCQVFIGNNKMTGITSWDYGHLTPIASELIAKKILVPTIIED